jgi:NodT family efflux transporter outer membrane factor (OMF) lipoprotein
MSRHTRPPALGQVLFALLALSGCLAIPPHDPPPLPDTAAYGVDHALDAALATPGFSRGDWPQADWWRVFHDPQLDRLIDQTLAGSPDLRIAAARVQLAQHQAAVVHADNLPQLQADASVTREHFSENYIIPPPIASQAHNEGQLALSASLDLDLWHRNRSLYAARLSSAQAAAADQAETRLLIGTAVAQTYFHLQALMAREDLAQDALAQRQDLARLVGLRVRAGLETQAAAQQADADVARARANQLALARERTATERALAALAGRGPDEVETYALTPGASHAPMPLPAILPMDLLARRPDVVATRWQVESAAQDVGAAKAGFYPNIDILGATGFQSLDLGKLLRPESFFASFGPAIHLPIYGGGRLRAQLGVAYDAYDIAVERYHSTLVNAARDVADQLGAVRSLSEQQVQQAQALRNAEAAAGLARLRYQQGLSDFIAVLQVQRDLLQQRDVNVQLEEAHAQAVVALIKSLGGGYLARPQSDTDLSLLR